MARKIMLNITRGNLIELYYHKNWSRYRIAQHLGVSDGVVRRLFREFGINFRSQITSVSKYDISKVAKLYNMGHSHQEIADMIGCTRQLITLKLQGMSRTRSEARRIAQEKHPEAWKDPAGKFTEQKRTISRKIEVFARLNQNIEFRRKRALAYNQRPNKMEEYLGKLIETACPNQYRYVGDGQIIINTLCPDFINVNGKKKVIELFGDYWHSPEVVRGNWKRTELGRIMICNCYGFDCLVIWEHELKQKSEEELIKTIKRFNKR